MKSIVPHQEFQQANFAKDGDIPQLEGGIGWAERGDWKKAQATFSQAIADSEKNPKIKSDQLAKCYWNLELAYEYAFLRRDNYEIAGTIGVEARMHAVGIAGAEQVVLAAGQTLEEAVVGACVEEFAIGGHAEARGLGDGQAARIGPG